MTRWLCGTCSGPGCGWASWAPAGSARSWAPLWRAARVPVVEAAPAPPGSAVGATVGAQTVGWYAGAGVDLRVDVAVESVQPDGLALAGGEWIAPDEIVTAVGG